MTLNSSTDGAWPTLRGCRIYRQGILASRLRRINFTRFLSRLRLLIYGPLPLSILPLVFDALGIGVACVCVRLVSAAWSGILLLGWDPARLLGAAEKVSS